MQGILGTSLNRPLFQVQYNKDKTLISIFYGFDHFATIPNDKRSYVFKSMVALLLRMGVCVRHIQQNFNISFITAKKYLKAFEEAEKFDKPIQDTLKNPGASVHKFTDEMADYTYERALHYEKEGRTYYHRFIIEDILQKFNIKVGRETIRLSLNKSRSANHSESRDKKDKESKNTQLEKIETFSHSQSRSSVDAKIFRNQYCGLLLMSSYAHLVFDGFDNQPVEGKHFIKRIIVWWVLSILSGALNLEQQRYFAINDFEFISGFAKLPSVESMRDILHDMSLSQELEVSTILLQKNIDYFTEDTSDFYLDPHIEQYTGKKNILSTWSTLKNRVCKSSVDTYVHDGAGNPLFSVLEDSFYDFREVIVSVMEKLENLYSKKNKKPFTLIYDRGGFSIELMEKIKSYKNIFIACPKEKTRRLGGLFTRGYYLAKRI